MSTIQSNVTVSVAEYLEGEKHSEVKREYVAGRLYAMVGASSTHNLIAGNLHAVLHQHLRGKPCQVFISGMKLRIDDSFYYPDIMVACDPNDRDDFYRERPVLVVEVLSPATTQRDHLDKRVAYQSIPDLKEYVLVSQDLMTVKIYRRTDTGWELETRSEHQRVRLVSVDLEIPIEAIYEDVW